MRVFKALTTAALFSALCVASAQAAIVIKVDKAAQMMSVSVDGAPRYHWPVSTGKSGHATPAGSFTTFRMEEDHRSKEWDDAPMPHSIFFTREGHAIHGSFDVKRLGTPASHGCVRLAPQNAATLFALVKAEGLPNTKVIITGEEPPVVAKRGTTRQRDQAAQRASAARVYPEPYADPNELDSYALRMRRRYQDERTVTQSQPYYVRPQPYYYERRGYAPFSTWD